MSRSVHVHGIKVICETKTNALLFVCKDFVKHAFFAKVNESSWVIHQSLVGVLAKCYTF